MNYVEVTLILISSEDYLLDLFIQDMADEGFESFQEVEFGVKAYMPGGLYSMKEVEAKIRTLFEPWIQKNLLTYEINLIPHKNWNKDWEMNFQPVSLGNRLLIRAPFHEPFGDFKYEIVIEPKMAFGTGHHETTCLMAEFLLEQSVLGKKVLDMGCGTGILGILADKMGAASTLAVDIDEICYQSSLENGILNEVRSMRVMKGDLPVLFKEADIKLGDYDIILANINRNILLDHMAGYSKLLKDGGNLFLSGFFQGEDLEMLIEEGRKSDLKYLFNKVQKGWCAAQFYK